METLEPQQVVKGGECWFEIAVERGPKGLEIFVKTDPRVEDFIKSLGSGKADPIEAYGRNWHSLMVGKDLMIYQNDKTVSSQTYTLEAPSEPFKSQRDGRVNLSFLRIVGIGDPGGVRFGIAGPFSKSYVREILSDSIQETRSLIRDYIVPVHLNLRITSTGV